MNAVGKDDVDMIPVLTKIAADSPDALFFPVSQREGKFVAEQAPTVAGLEDIVLLATDVLLVDEFMRLEASEGTRFSAPDFRFGTNVNESTGKSAADVVAAYEVANGDPPRSPAWTYSYDATAMLLDAIDAASLVNADGNLEIDRSGVREHLDGIRAYSGITGTINCDDFGDCGSPMVTIIEHLDAGDIGASRANVIFEYTPP